MTVCVCVCVIWGRDVNLEGQLQDEKCTQDLACYFLCAIALSLQYII